MSRYRIPFNRPAVTQTDRAYLDQALGSGHLSGDGEFTARCHALMERAFGAEHVRLTTSCTTALEMAALLCELEPGDEVVMPSYTFVSTANAFALRRAKVVFTDIRPDTLNLDEQQLAGALTNRTRVIVPVHYAGVACAMDEIESLAREHGLLIVEDAAQGVNARHRGRFLGTIGDFGTYSFHETKNIVCGEGGALLTNNEKYRKRAEIIRDKGTNRAQFHRGEVDKYTWTDVGLSALPSDLLAAYLLGQLENMEVITARRREIYEGYHAQLRDLVGRGELTLPSIPADCQSNFHMVHILMNDLETRSKLIDHLKRYGILSAFHYVPLHTSPVGREMGYKSGMFPVTENISDRVLRLPMYFDLADDEVAEVSERIREFFVGRR